MQIEKFDRNRVGDSAGARLLATTYQIVFIRSNYTKYIKEKICQTKKYLQNYCGVKKKPSLKNLSSKKKYKGK